MKQLICRTDEMSINEIKPVKVGEESILLFRLDDGFYATQSRCTHLFRSMAKGHIVDGNIQCPLHRAKFCIKTGDVKEWANFPPGVQLLNSIRKEKPLKIYTVTVKDDQVYISLP